MGPWRRVQSVSLPPSLYPSLPLSLPPSFPSSIKCLPMEPWLSAGVSLPCPVVTVVFDFSGGVHTDTPATVVTDTLTRKVVIAEKRKLCFEY